MEKKIITISREYGSGGRQIGLVAAKKLGMEFYDKELIDAAAKEIGFPAEIIADREQRLTNSLLYNFAMGTLYGLSYPKEPKLSELPLTEQIYVAQKKAIEEAAKRGSCVFIGRCADYILRSRPDVLRVFVYADRDIRLRRAIDEYGDLESISMNLCTRPTNAAGSTMKTIRISAGATEKTMTDAEAAEIWELRSAWS